MVSEFLRRRGISPGRVVGKEASATTLATVWLPLIRPTTEESDLRALNCVLGLRNNILHNAQTAISGGDQAESVRLVVQLASALCAERAAADG